MACSAAGLLSASAPHFLSLSPSVPSSFPPLCLLHIYTWLTSTFLLYLIFQLSTCPCLFLPFLSSLSCSASVLPLLFLIHSLSFPGAPLHWKHLLEERVPHSTLEMCKHQHCPWACRTCTFMRCCPRCPMKSFLSNGPAFRKEGSEICAIHVLCSVGVSLFHQTVLSASLCDLQTILAPLSCFVRKHLIYKSYKAVKVKKYIKVCGLQGYTVQGKIFWAESRPCYHTNNPLIPHLFHPVCWQTLPKPG